MIQQAISRLPLCPPQFTRSLTTTRIVLADVEAKDTIDAERQRAQSTTTGKNAISVEEAKRLANFNKHHFESKLDKDDVRKAWGSIKQYWKLPDLEKEWKQLKDQITGKY